MEKPGSRGEGEKKEPAEMETQKYIKTTEEARKSLEIRDHIKDTDE